MDDIYLPDEEGDEAAFEKHEIEEAAPTHPSGVTPSKYVSITFDRFVQLVAQHSFLEVVEANRHEEVIISTNLLTDLANSRRVHSSSKGNMLVVAGVVLGILLGYLFFA